MPGEQSVTRGNHVFTGWRLRAIIATFLLGNFLATLLFKDIDTKETVSFLIRTTAKLSFLLFMLAFAASSLYHYLKTVLQRGS